MPYKLSATLSAHSSDVRAVVSPTDTLVLSASRDTTAISWRRESPISPFTHPTVYRAGSRFVNAIAYIAPSPEAPNGLIITGGQEAIINVFQLGAEHEDPEYSLLGHTDNVCALDALSSGTIISGSWDKTARIWKSFQSVRELVGHEQAVWAVLAVDDDTYLTGSADKTIRLWIQHKTMRTYNGHTDAVRGLALLPSVGFASCANDSEIRVWTTEGDVIYTLSGHTSFVYSLSVLPSGDIVSSGEDRTVRIWRDGECIQTISHPAISVWSVSSMPNGDIVSGSSDGHVRVFSTSEERWASKEDLKAYEEQVAAQALPSQQIGDVKKSDLPDAEALSMPGKKAGEVKMIRNGGKVEAHQWDAMTSAWQKIGEVVDAVGPGRKQLHEGKEYDYVFDVDIQDGVPPLKLPYNVTENPYNAAQRFLANNDLPPSYLDEVVRFIEQNTKGVQLSSASEFVDPYTGTSRYTAAATVASTGPTSSYQDPFTGANRYTPQTTQQQPVANNMPSSDPFTGASRYSPAASVPVLSNQETKVLPVRTLLSFKQANVPAMRTKILQINEAFKNEISTEPMALYPEELMTIDTCLAFLTNAVMTPIAAKSSTLSSSCIDVLAQILERWPSSSRFPIIDLGRLLSGYCPQIYAEPPYALKFFHALLHAAEWEMPWEAPLPKYRDTNVLLALRALTNAFQDSPNSQMTQWVQQVFEEVATVPYAALSKSHRVTLATALFNFSCIRLKGPISLAVDKAHMSMMVRILQEEEADAETVYRALVGFGNTIYAYKMQATTVVVPATTDFNQLLNMTSAKFSEERIANLANEIKALLH